MNLTPLQKVKARLYFLNGKNNPYSDDNAYNIYQLHGENTKEFKAITQEHEQVKKRDLLQTLLKEMKLK